jgi:hypothetical protein
MKGYSISTGDVHVDLIISGTNDQKSGPKEQKWSNPGPRNLQL